MQVYVQEGVSFDWWTHVGYDTQRYTGTIYAGSAQQHYEVGRTHGEIPQGNVFNNPLNDYELVTGRQLARDVGVIDARRNYWGFPGTEVEFSRQEEEM